MIRRLRTKCRIQMGARERRVRERSRGSPLDHFTRAWKYGVDVLAVLSLTNDHANFYGKQKLEPGMVCICLTQGVALLGGVALLE